MTTPYADFTYYSGTFLGTAIVSADFGALALKASALIDKFTFQRALPIWDAGTETATIDSISMACCALAETLQNLAQSSEPDGIQSESVGPMKVSYTKSAAKSQTAQTKYKSAIIDYIDQELLFPGFSSDEYGTAP